MEKSEKDILLQKYADVNRKLILANEQLAIANKKLKEYEEKAQKAEKASKMKSLFLANMSHEIRTPLNAIEGFSRVLVETDSQEDRMKFYEIIESNNSRLSSLVNEILDLSRVESGEIVMKKTPTDLNELCSSIKNLFKFRCPDSVQLVWKKPLMSVTFNTDANRLTQVFSNLISNATAIRFLMKAARFNSSSRTLVQVLLKKILNAFSRRMSPAMQKPPRTVMASVCPFVRLSSKNWVVRLL